MSSASAPGSTTARHGSVWTSRFVVRPANKVLWSNAVIKADL
jgi:hypothetical protein